MNTGWVFVATALGMWIVHSLWFPWTSCGQCAGGKHYSDSGRAWRNCRACGGSGKRRRVVAKLLGRGK